MYITIIFCSFCACNNEVDSDNFMIKVERLRIDEKYSIIVNQKYNNTELIDVKYSIDNNRDNDKYGILDLRGNDNENLKVNLIFFKSPKVINGEKNNDFFTSIEVPESYLGYGCGCNDTAAQVNDCVLRKYYNLRYCDGNFCNACSLEISLDDEEKPIINDIEDFKLSQLKSVIILPQNIYLTH